jgi:hypothetical protein
MNYELAKPDDDVIAVFQDSATAVARASNELLTSCVVLGESFEHMGGTCVPLYASEAAKLANKLGLYLYIFEDESEGAD